MYLIPGMFGFGRLAGYAYFGHLDAAITGRYAAAGIPVIVEVVPTPPTASIRRRARVLSQAIARSAGEDDGPIHLIGHSTGGLDARLLVSPSAAMDLAGTRAWTSRVASIVTLSTPHYGSPLAAFFATVSGTRLLYAISLLTVTSLSVGSPPLAAFSSLVAAVGSMDEAFGADIQLLDRTTDLILRFIGDRGREDVYGYLEGIRHDQGGIIQIMPEAMDLFNAAVENATSVRYGCVVAAAPKPGPVRFVTSIRSPYAAASAALYSTLYTIAARASERYPYATLDPSTQGLLEAALDEPLDESVTDGIVPTQSMLWGDVLWAGKADHLDVVGHFRDDEKPETHVDWLASGAGFNRQRFRAMCDAIVRMMLAGEAPPEIAAGGGPPLT